MRKLTFFIGLFLVCAFASDERKPDHSLETPADAIVTDNLANVYVVSKDKFTKYDLKLKFMKEFSNKNFGNITTADVNNPLRVLLFYREFGRIVFLDNTLSQNGEPIALEKLGYPLATLAASSYDNGLWIYDQPTFELLRFTTALEISNRTGNLSQILGIELQPNFILEKDNRLFVNNPATGILVFDVFGTYIKTIPLLNLTNFQVADDEIVYFSEDILHSWNITTSEITDYSEPRSSTAISMRMERDAIFVHDSTLITGYIRKK
jgi:hypothetical protein